MNCRIMAGSITGRNQVVKRRSARNPQGNRVDLRNTPLVTIDGEDARDLMMPFIAKERQKAGNYW